MATKTLGVKFEIAGVKEAQAGLKNLQTTLKQNIEQNRQAVNKSIGLNKTVRQSIKSSDPDDFVNNYQRTVAAVRNRQYQQAAKIYARPRINRVVGGYFEGIGSAAGERAFGKLDNLFRKLTGREEYKETVSLDNQTIDDIGLSVAHALKGKAQKQSARDKNIGRNKPLFKQESLFDKAVSQVMMPIKTLQYAFYEGIGSDFGSQFAKGLSEILNKDLDFSMNRKGQVSGKAIVYTATQGVKNFKQDVSAVGKNFNDFRYAMEDGKINQLSQKFDTLIKSITKSVVSIGDSYLRGFRKGSVQLEALRSMEKEINAQSNNTPDLADKNKVIFAVSGFAGEKGQRGEYLAKQIKPYVNDQTEVIGVANEFTDVLAPADKNAVMWGISALANLAKINLKGFNPDAVKLAAKVVNTLSKNPNVDVEMLGHSAGGFVVEEAQEILDQLGLGNKVKTKTVGTPRMAGNLDNKNVTKIIGDGDFRIKPLEEALEYFGAANPTENIVGGVDEHFFDDYLKSDEFLTAAFGDSLDKDKVAAIRKSQQKFQGKLIELETLYSKYMSTIYQDLDELGEELSVAPDRLIAKRRRGMLRDRGGQEVQRKLNEKDFREIKLKDGVETAILVSGGFSGARGRSGAKFAKDANALVDDPKTQYVGVRNPFTDVIEPDEIRNPDTQKMIPKILEMFGQVHQIGYNPDAAEIAAQVMDLLAKNPNLKVKVGGFSGGGYVAEDVMELLKSQDADMSRVEVQGIGAPDLPGGIKNRDFKKILGATDPVVAANQLKALNEEIRKIIGIDVFPQLMTRLQNIEGIEKHDLEEYIAKSSEVQEFFYGHIPGNKELLGNYSQITELQSQAGNLNSEIETIGNDDSLDSAQKLTKLNSIRQQYISLLRQIHTLARYSQSIGGGKFFAQEREVSALELEEAGVIVDPIQIKIEDDPWQDVPEQEQEAINDRNKSLALRYKKYLQNISVQTQKVAAIPSQVIARDFATQNPDKQKDFLTYIREEFTAKAKAYRQSIKSGQLEIAAKQGENLLHLAASIKSLYSELANFDQLDPEVQSTFKSYSGYVSSVENEIISGVGGSGRINVGLPNLFEDEMGYAEIADDGEYIAEGFINGILESLLDAKDAGEQLVDAVDEGIREQGEIQSPSKLAKRLGRWFAQGFGLGMAAENMEQRGRDVVENAADGFKDEIKNAFDPSNIAELIDTGGAGVIKKIGEILFNASQNEQFDKVLGVISQLIGKLVRLFVTFKLLKVGLDALGLGKLKEAFTNLTEKSLDAAIGVEALDNRIIQMSGSAQAGAKNLRFITAEAARLNRNLTEAKENFTQVLRATRDTSLEGYQTENIYTAFAATAKANALSAADEQGLFRSVRSMIGKGILQSEEVRGEIGERLGDFEQSLAEAYGVSRPQLNQMITNREVVATEALPKVAAVLRAKNDIFGDLDTGAAAAQRAENAVGSFHESVGNALLPLQKFGNNFLAKFFNQLASGIDLAKGLVHGFFIALFVNLLRLQIFGQSIQKLLLGLIKLLWTMKDALGIFLAEVLLIAVAWKVWESVIKQFSDRFFPKINKEIEQLTRGMKAYRQAIDEARGATDDLSNTKLQLAEGLKLPENKFGDAVGELIGSNYLNLDSLIREPLAKFSRTGLGKFALSTGLINPMFLGGRTRRENKEEQLKIDNANLSNKGNQLYSQNGEAFSAVKEINKYDAQIADIQSARLKLLPGDNEALTASLEAEKKINQKRDEQLRIVTNYQQTVTTAIGTYKSRLEDVGQRFLEGEIDEPTYIQERNNLEGLLSDSEKLLKRLNDGLSAVSKNLTAFQRRLRNSNERVDGFLATSDRNLQLEKAAIIEAGISGSAGTQTIQIELEEAQRADLLRRIQFIKTEIAQIESDLNSPELAAGAKRIRQRLADNNIELNETTLQRIINETTVKADRDAAQGLLDKLRRDTQLSGYIEQFAQSLQQNRNALIDYQRTIDDYFFNINQQIKETQVEVLRVINQIIQISIKNKLQAALSPNTNSFVNSLISSTQSILDQAASYADKILGQRSARIQFAGQERSLQYELNDFARNVRGAGDALIEFQDKLKDAPVKNKNNNSSDDKTIINTASSPELNVLPVPKRTNFAPKGILPAPPPLKEAAALKDLLVDKQKQKLDLTDSLIAKQEKEALQIAIANFKKSDRQKVDFNITDSQFALDKLIDAGRDLSQQYDFSTATGEALKALRAFNTAFSDRAQAISREIIKYTQEINAINDLTLNAPADIKRLRKAGRNDEADILAEQLANAQLLLSPYQEILEGLTAEYLNNTAIAKVGLTYVNATNKLKIEQEKLNKRSLLLNQQGIITGQRGTLEQQRKVKLHQEDLRLALKINELRQQHAPGEYLDSLIQGERRQSQVNTENINYDSQIAELELEKKLLDIKGGINDRTSGLRARIGDVLGGDKLKKDTAIAQENLRFERELIELRKEFADRPEELEKLTRAATELNRVSLLQIENQFKSLGRTVEDIFISSTQGFFNNITTNLFDGSVERERALLQQRLSYAEQLVSLENQYRDKPGELAHLKNRARELNEQKLDKIKQEFNIFGRVVNLAKQALGEFVKQLALVAAKQAAAKFLGSILGSALGGIGGGGVSAVGNDANASRFSRLSGGLPVGLRSSAAGVSAFTADDGQSVGSDIKSRKVSDRTTNYLRRNFPGIARAWKKEGRDAQLGVFHKNEELISDKTGEAPAYRGLKRLFGDSPARKIIANFSEGGTVGSFDAKANALSGFNLSVPQFDSALLNSTQTGSNSTSKTINLNQTIVSPNADSFRLNSDQRNQDLMESLRRGI